MFSSYQVSLSHRGESPASEMAYFLAVLSNVEKDLRWTNDFEKKGSFLFFQSFWI